MKLLVLSFYYAPDLCAGSFRCTALVDALRAYDIEIEVVTTLPNRYASFSAEAPAFEESEQVKIHRVALPEHASGMADQSKAFRAFYNAARKLTAPGDYDAVVATSSRLFTAFLGARIARQKRIPLYLDIRDIFVDTLNDVLPKKITWAALPVLNQIERYTFNSATRINLVSPGFADYFKTRYPRVDYQWFTNGIDNEFLEVAPSVSRRLESSGRVKVLYAGNIGEGQGLHRIIPTLAKRMHDSAEFKIIGAGGRLAELEVACEGLDNVELLPPVGRKDLIEAYQSADVLFLHLNDYEAFKKVLPSKIFEYAALGKPVWAGVGGYAAEFLRENVENSGVFEPGNAESAVASFGDLRLEEVPRSDFVSKFARTAIMRDMAADIVNFVQEQK
ncbi:glycosyltransferase family 4 protein [Pseudidiomarina terrestris]|uniref:glycosyltransferase family 4 protein n=1 Tax=Pseudidiomarina terrestris TaxID=2820060 RepID=UPI002656F8DC|nr:glycosyltransferase family 4 protein [Pseudidiomarina sp. 1ASP75-5]MDN7134547.1 glycosyltransferase family 4 protein [Pseudidiomarina sp. 1ASP75-5]